MTPTSTVPTHRQTWLRGRTTTSEPTTRQLLAMAEGRLRDPRQEPTVTDLRAAEREVPKLLAEWAGRTYHHLDELHADGRRALDNNDRASFDAAEAKIDDAWDAIGHLAMGT